LSAKKNLKKLKSTIGKGRTLKKKWEMFDAGKRIVELQNDGFTTKKIAEETGATSSYVRDVRRAYRTFPERQRRYGFSWSVYLEVMRKADNPVAAMDWLASLKGPVTKDRARELLKGSSNGGFKMDFSGNIDPGLVISELKKYPGSEKVKADIELNGSGFVLCKGEHKIEELLRHLPSGVELEGRIHLEKS